jgi:CHAT domain-containing protein
MVAQMALGVQSGQGTPVMGPENLFPDPRCGAGRTIDNVTAPPLTRLVFHVLEDRTAVFLASRTGQVRVHVAPIGRDALERRVAEFRQALDVDSGGNGLTVSGITERPSPDAYHLEARRLYDDLVAPVAGAVQDDELVVVEPHGPLWLVPFAVLEDRAGRPLIDRWALLYSPSAQILDGIRSEPAFAIPADLSALIVGNPTPPSLDVTADDRFRGGVQRATFQPLPGAEREAKIIGNLLPEAQRQVLIGAAATLWTVEQEAPRHTVIHLASHALAYSEQPLDSFVMLAADKGTNDQLTARRVVDLPLHADLVTLSACQTGIGQLSGDGVIGLSRAFLARGARSVLVSQWSVSDTATAGLMTSFYLQYFSGAADKARALRKAVNDVRAQPGFGHPKFWAPFVLIGSER